MDHHTCSNRIKAVALVVEGEITQEDEVEAQEGGNSSNNNKAVEDEAEEEDPDPVAEAEEAVVVAGDHHPLQMQSHTVISPRTFPVLPPSSNNSTSVYSVYCVMVDIWSGHWVPLINFRIWS